MSIATSIQNLRTDLAIRQAKVNAQLQAYSDTMRSVPSFNMAFAVGFMFMLVSLVGVGAPVSAEVNLSGISDVITGFTGIIPDLMDLIIAVIPMVFTLAVYSFIIGLLAAILGLIKVNL